MKKTLTILIILLCSTFLLAQTESHEDVKWRTYISPKDNFSVELPKFVKELFFSVSEGGEEEVHKGGQYLSSINNEFFNVFSLVIPKDTIKDSMLPLPPTLKEFVEENAKSSQSIKFNNYPAREWIFKDNEGFCHRVLDVQTKTRVFVFHAIYENGDSLNIDRFFDSIKFYPNLKTKLLQNKLKTSMLKNKLEKDKEEKNKTYVKRLEPKSSKTVVENSSSQTKPLKLTSKPRAAYTDLARMYQITGNIKLRVTFLADGTIGEIVSVKKLPFGLTNSAITAAKNIIFEPSQKENIPVTVTKQVEYHFTLY